MAQIREFRVDDNRPEENIDYKDKIRTHKKRSFIRNSVIIIVLALVGTLIYIYAKNQVYSQMVTTRQTDYHKVAETSFVESNGRFITYSKDGISCMDTKGSTIWNLTFEMQNPIVHAKGNMVAAADYNGHIVYLIDEKGTTTQIDTNLPIRSYALDESGNVAVILEDINTAWVNLYSKNGEKLAEAKATMTKTGYPVTVAVAGEVMGISYFYVDGENMKSSVTYCNFGGVGENVTDHIVSSYDYVGAVVPVLEFLDDENVFAVADNRLMFYKGSRKPVSTADVLLNEEIQGVYHGDGKVALIFYDKTGEGKYRMDVYATDGKKQVSIIFDMDFKDIILRNDQIFLYNEQQCCIYNMKGKMKYEGFFEGTASFVMATDSARKFAVIEDDSIKMVELK